MSAPYAIIVLILLSCGFEKKKMYLSEDGRTLIQVDLADISADGCFNLPGTINSIGFAAYLDCIELTQLILPEILTEIEESAFDGCTRLTQVIFPEIGAWGFLNCTGIKQIMLPESLAKIGGGAFRG